MIWYSFKFWRDDFKKQKFIKQLYFVSNIKNPVFPKMLFSPLSHQNPLLGQKYFNFTNHLGQSLLPQCTAMHTANPFNWRILKCGVWLIGMLAGEQMGHWCWDSVLIYCPGVFLITRLIGTATPLWNNNVPLIITDLSLLIAYSYQLTSRNQAESRNRHREITLPRLV